MKNFFKATFVLLFFAFLSFYLYIKNFYFKGYYEDFLYYEIKSSQIYFKFYVDKFYNFYQKRFSNKFSKGYFDFSNFEDMLLNYPANYAKINQTQKKIISKNFLLKFYVKSISKSQIKISGDVEVYDKNSLPFYLNYLDGIKVKTDVNFDKDLNIENIKGDLKNEYINLSFIFDKIQAKVDCEAFFSYLNLESKREFNKISLTGTFFKIKYVSFPVSNLKWEFKTNRAILSYYPFNIDLQNVKIDGNQREIFFSSDKVILKNFKDKIFNYLVIEKLRSQFEVNYFDKFWVVDLDFGADGRIDKKWGLKDLDLKTQVAFDKEITDFWIYKLKFKSIEGLDLDAFKKIEKEINKYEILYNEISPNLWGKFSSISKELKEFFKLKSIENFRIFLKPAYFLFINQDFYLEIEEQNLRFFHNQIFIYSYNLKNFLSFFKNELLDLNLESGKVLFFSTIRCLFFSFKYFKKFKEIKEIKEIREFKAFWTDYYNEVFLSKIEENLFFDVKIRKEHTFNKLLSLVKFDKIFNNVVKKNLDIKTNEFSMVGIISQNEVVLNFNLGGLFSFVKVDDFSFKNILKISKKFSPKKFSSKKFSLLEKVKLIVFNRDNYFVFDRSYLFINFSQWFFYYEVDINKILSLIKGFSKYLNVYENLGKILKGNNYLVFKKDFF
ncbi:MAG: hypothetical protein ACK4GR_03370, partial [bacterium]